jgi:hypothetical protein
VRQVRLVEGGAEERDGVGDTELREVVLDAEELAAQGRLYTADGGIEPTRPRVAGGCRGTADGRDRRPRYPPRDERSIARLQARLAAGEPQFAALVRRSAIATSGTTSSSTRCARRR